MAWVGVEHVTSSLQEKHLTIAPMRTLCTVITSNKLYIMNISLLNLTKNHPLINISWNRNTYINHLNGDLKYNSSLKIIIQYKIIS